MAKRPMILTLNRILSLPVITLYGIGTMVGAGIYGLIGEVIHISGMFTPYSFLISAIIALFTSLSYGELSSLLPKSAGEAAYAREGFRNNNIAILVGWLTIVTGVVSSSSILSSFIGYLHLFYHFDIYLSKVLVAVFITALAAWGVSWSVGIACLITLVEIGGLIYIIYLGGSGSISYYIENWSDLLPPASLGDMKSVFLGSFLAFYAFIGFEDMVNMAEEVKSPRKTLYKAILIALLVASVLYILISFVAVSAISTEALTKSETPLADLVATKGERARWTVGMIGVTSLVNGGLVQILMASRVVYGMSRQRMAPKVFSYVNPKTKTPLIATATIGFITLILMLFFQHLVLAKTTTFVILIIFSAVNLSLILIKRRNNEEKSDFKVPTFVPYVGLIINLSLLIFQAFWQFNK